EARIAAGMFRQDLYFRLAQFTVQLPPLRLRKEDVPLLAGHFLSLFATEMGMKAPALTPEALETLRGHHFPGNVRELKNVIERGLIESGGDAIGPEHLKLAPQVAVTVHAAAREREPVGAGAVVEQLPLKLEDAEEMLI